MMTAFEPTWLSAVRFLSVIARAPSVDPPRLEMGILTLHQLEVIGFSSRSGARPAPARADEEHDERAQAREPEQIADVAVEAATRKHRQVDQQRLRRGRRKVRRIDRFGLVSEAAAGVDVGRNA